ncbi:unnamed protein product [Psylliodes chrysocephalus]|uniref:Uncharacterized protein n=1 Tax=Psylliodes chrysocephalus TaxID=3402493 RepID=A0A9P0CXU5_9CUCU|nr:unnamed protein product [Psylliodes chrysocephala]
MPTNVSTRSANQQKVDESAMEAIINKVCEKFMNKIEQQFDQKFEQMSEKFDSLCHKIDNLDKTVETNVNAIQKNIKRMDDIEYNFKKNRIRRCLKGTGIFINEDLVEKSYKLFMKAIKIFNPRNVWTRGGRIYIKSKNDVVHIKDEQDLSNISPPLAYGLLNDGTANKFLSRRSVFVLHIFKPNKSFCIVNTSLKQSNVKALSYPNMGEDSPGSSNPQQTLRAIIKSKLTIEQNELLNSLHQLSPAQNKSLLDLEKELYKTLEEFKDNEEVSREIIQLKNKVTACKSKIVTYSQSDFGPFTVIVEQKVNGENIPSLHPMDLGKRFHALGISNVKSIKKKGKHRVGVSFNLPHEANKILCNETLLREGYKIYIPQRFLTVKGIIRDVGYSITSEDILQNAGNKYNIIEARRLNRRIVTQEGIQYLPSSTFLLTFKGKKRPEEIEIYTYHTKVFAYVPPVTQCRNCLRFGHAQIQCRSKKRCNCCGESHENCDKEPVCIFCDQNHKSTDKNCPEFSRQKNINELMSFQDLSYYEASQLSPPIISRNINKFNFQRTPQSFPPLNATLSESSSSARRSYAKVTMTPKRKKVNVIEKTGYDILAHKGALLPQPTRLVSQSSVYQYTQEKVTPNTKLDSQPSVYQCTQGKITPDNLSPPHSSLKSSWIDIHLDASDNNNPNDSESMLIDDIPNTPFSSSFPKI